MAFVMLTIGSRRCCRMFDMELSSHLIIIGLFQVAAMNAGLIDE